MDACPVTRPHKPNKGRMVFPSSHSRRCLVVHCLLGWWGLMLFLTEPYFFSWNKTKKSYSSANVRKNSWQESPTMVSYRVIQKAQIFTMQSHQQVCIFYWKKIKYQQARQAGIECRICRLWLVCPCARILCLLIVGLFVSIELTYLAHLLALALRGSCAVPFSTAYFTPRACLELHQMP